MDKCKLCTHVAMKLHHTLFREFSISWFDSLFDLIFLSHRFGEKFSKDEWIKEINGQREILNLYAGVAFDDIRGMRAPFLQTGGNNMFEMLYETNFTYDSSLPVQENSPPYWPYTLDYAISHSCNIPPCPTRSFPGKIRK